MANAYSTAAEFKTWVKLNDSIDDVNITAALEAASTAIDKYTRTHFWKTPAGTARVFDTCYSNRLGINDAVAVTQVATDTDSDGTYETVWTAGDFQLWPLNPDAGPETEPFTQVWAIGALTFPRAIRRQGLVRVTGTWGWAAVPEPVVQSALMVTNRLIGRPGSPHGVAGFSEFGVVRISAREDPDVVRLLERYRKNRRPAGWGLA